MYAGALTQPRTAQQLIPICNLLTQIVTVLPVDVVAADIHTAQFPTMRANAGRIWDENEGEKDKEVNTSRNKEHERPKLKPLARENRGFTFAHPCEHSAHNGTQSTMQSEPTAAVGRRAIHTAPHVVLRLKRRTMEPISDGTFCFCISFCFCCGCIVLL